MAFHWEGVWQQIPESVLKGQLKKLAMQIRFFRLTFHVLISDYACIVTKQ